jgi:alpha-beta hydrolase superfamily lysophospholipase
MAASKPVFLLAHGSWHTPYHYKGFIDCLNAAGYETVAPCFASSTENPPPNAPAADVEILKECTNKLVDQGREVIVVAHSYGGVIATDALSGLGIRQRKEQGLTGGVTRIIYVAAFILLIGKTLESNAPVEQIGWCRYEVQLRSLKWLDTIKLISDYIGRLEGL